MRCEKCGYDIHETVPDFTGTFGRCWIKISGSCRQNTDDVFSIFFIKDSDAKEKDA